MRFKRRALVQELDDVVNCLDEARRSDTFVDVTSDSYVREHLKEKGTLRAVHWCFVPYLTEHNHICHGLLHDSEMRLWIEIQLHQMHQTLVVMFRVESD